MYEREYGQVGREWDRSAQIEIHYMLQEILHLLGAVNTEKGKQNPVPEPKRMPAPNEYQPPDDEEG